jgi:hypothetical protein
VSCDTDYSTFRHSWGELDENRLKRCLKGVIRCEWWISELQGVVGFVLVSTGCVTAQTFSEIEDKGVFLFFSPFVAESLLLFLTFLSSPSPRCSRGCT